MCMKSKKAVLFEQYGITLIDTTHIMDPYKNSVCLPLKHGNSKLDKTVLTWSLPAVKTCPGAVKLYGPAGCPGCYGCEGCYNFKDTKENIERLFGYCVRYPDWIKNAIIAQIAWEKPLYVRIHATGDFYNLKYISMWREIISMFPNVLFWTYTKSDIIDTLKPGIEKLESLDNMHIVKSIIPDGRLNYALTLDELEAMKTEIEAAGHTCFICACGTENEVKCGNACHACATYEYVLFLDHSKAAKMARKKLGLKY